jgi:hypothetical protein
LLTSLSPSTEIPIKLSSAIFPVIVKLFPVANIPIPPFCWAVFSSICTWDPFIMVSPFPLLLVAVFPVMMALSLYFVYIPLAPLLVAMLLVMVVLIP